MTPKRLADIAAWRRDADMCPASCLVVRDLIDEIEALRDHVRGLLARAEAVRMQTQAQRDVDWQRHLKEIAHVMEQS